MQLQFRDLHVGDTFDWIDDNHRDRNSFYDRCVKTSARGYRTLDGGESATRNYTVGSVRANVFHVSIDGKGN